VKDAAPHKEDQSSLSAAIYLGHSMDAALTVNGVTIGIAAPYKISTGRICLVIDLVYPGELHTS